MKFNLSNPQAGTQKSIEIDDLAKIGIFNEKSVGQEIEVDSLGPEFKGYVFKITGGNDKDGFPMYQGVKARGRVRLLLRKGHSCYRPKRTGERRRKSVRGCIVGDDIRVLSLALIKKGQAEIQGLTDTHKAKRLGPKRASKIRKLFGLKKDDPKELILKNVIRRTFKTAAGKDRVKAPKIQRLITDSRTKKKEKLAKAKKLRGQNSAKLAKNYHELIEQFKKTQRQKIHHHQEKKQKQAPKVVAPVKEVKKEQPKTVTKEVKPAPAATTTKPANVPVQKKK